MPVGLISHVRRFFFSSDIPRKIQSRSVHIYPRNTDIWIHYWCCVGAAACGKGGFGARGVACEKPQHARTQPRTHVSKRGFFFSPSTLNLKYSHPRTSEPPPPLILVWPWTHRPNMLQVCATRSNETAMAEPMQRQHTPLRSSPRAACEHTLSDTHTHTHTRPHSLVDTRARTHPSLDRQMNEQSTAPWAVKTRLDVTGWPNVQMQPCDTFQWGGGGGGERGRVRACVRAAG